MRNTLQDIDIKTKQFFWWYYQYERFWSKWNYDRWKVIQKYCHSLHWICDDQRFEICENPLYLIINKVNGYFEEINKSKYLTLVSTNENKEIIKKYEDLWSQIRDIISSIIKNSETILLKSIWKSNLIQMMI